MTTVNGHGPDATEGTAPTGAGTARVKRGMAEMLKGGVIMDVVNAEQVHSLLPSTSTSSHASNPPSAHPRRPQPSN